jgi:hypothetical protein
MSESRSNMTLTASLEDYQRPRPSRGRKGRIARGCERLSPQRVERFGCGVSAGLTDRMEEVNRAPLGLLDIGRRRR